MNERRTDRILRFFPSFTDVAFLLPVLFLMLKLDGARTMLGDGDTGWHIRAGDWMLAHGRVPDKDFFSFTRPGEPWFAWEWLWDVSFAWLHQHGGLAAVVLVSLLILCVTTALVYRLAWRSSGNALIAIAVTMLAVSGSSLHWLARPHLFTLLFVVLFFWILEEAHQGRRRLLFWLPPLTMVWANLHGGFFVGIVLASCYAIGELARALAAPAGERRLCPGRAKPFALAGAACLVASLANPYFYQLHLHIFSYLTDSYHFQNINEFFSISFHNPVAIYFELMIILGVIAAFRTAVRKQFHYTLLLGLWLHLALLSARNIPVFLFIAAPIVAGMLAELLRALAESSESGWAGRAASTFREFAAGMSAVDRIPRVYLTSGLAAVLIAALFYAPSPPSKFRAEYNPKHYPEKALALLEGSDRVFTTDEWGDYLIYRLYPGRKVFIDGRSDFYGSRFGEQYLSVINVKYDWQRHLSRYDVDTVLLPVESALAGALKESRRWVIVYDDGVAIVFRLAGKQVPRVANVLSERHAASITGVNWDRDPGITEPAVVSGSRVQSKQRR